MKPKIYLAGKISKNGWRHDIVDNLRRIGHDIRHHGGMWRVSEKVIFNQFSYTGPYFIGCDHGCTHNTIGHTWAANYECVDYNYDLELSPLIWNLGTHDECTDPNSKGAHYVTIQCRNAIDISDIFFAWFGENYKSAYGTMVEIGYAVARGVPVWIGLYEDPDCLHAINDLDVWFALNLAEKYGYYETAKEALWDMTKELREMEQIKTRLESPIEEKFWNAINKNGFPYTLTPQHHIGRFRVDFAILSHKIVIELDGHDYHKTKEQRTHDARRERLLKMDGWDVVRFTGSEIWRDVDGCVKQLRNYIEAKGA